MINLFKIILFILFSITLVEGQSIPACGKNTGLACPAPDVDGDGFTTDGTLKGYDCNDSDWQQFPGVWKFESGYFYKCQNDGTWTSGTLVPSEGLNNYFINCDAPVNGTGVIASPWNNLTMISSLQWSAPPAGWRNPQAGDTFWIAGNCDDQIDRDGVPGGETYGYFILNRDGTSLNKIRFMNWPGMTRGHIKNVGSRISYLALFDGSDHLEIWGLEFSGFADYGIALSTSDNIRVENVYVHDIDGEATNNNSGVAFTSVTNSSLEHSHILNNYDVEKCTGVPSLNNRGVVLFQGTGNKVNYNVIRNTAACGLGASALNRGIGHKHGDKVTKTNSTFEAAYNIISGFDGAIESGQAGTWIHHTYADARSMCFSAEDVGGTTYLNNFLVEYNTCRGNNTVLNFDWDANSFLFTSIAYATVANYSSLPGTGDAQTVYTESENNNRYRWNGTGYDLIYAAYASYANLAAFPGTGVVGTIYIALDTGNYYRWNGSAYVDALNVIRHNVLLSNASSYTSEVGFLVDSVYGSNALYDLFSTIKHIDYRTNCYHNLGTATPVFNHFNSSSGGRTKGAQYFFSAWETDDTTSPNNKPAWDDDSFIENPLLNSISNATSSNCSNKGYLAGLSGGGSPIISPTPTPSPSPTASLSAVGDFNKRRPYNPFDW